MGEPATYNDAPAGPFGVHEAAAALGMSARQVRRLCSTGDLAATRDAAGLWLIGPDAHPALRVARGMAAIQIARDEGGEQQADLAGLSAAKRARIQARFEALRCYEEALARRQAGQTVGQFLPLWVAGWNLIHPETPLSAKTLRRWRRRLATAGIAGLADRRRYHGPSPCSPAAWDLFRGMYLAEARPHMPRLHEFVAAQAEINGWAWPALRTVRRWVARKLDPKLAALGRDPKRYRDRCTPTIERDWSQVPAMACWVGDHRQIDALWPRHLWNAKRERWDWVYNRPWLTMFLDARSWMPAAWSICFDSPDGNRVMATFVRGVVAHGQPEMLYLDNGKDFRMIRFAGGRRRFARPGERICPQRVLAPMLEALDIQVTWALPYNARAKIVEPWFGIMAERFDKASPTYCGRSPQTRPEGLGRLTGRAEAVAAEFVASEDMDAVRYQGLPQAARDRIVLEPLRLAFEAWLMGDYALRQSPSKAAGGLPAGRAFVELRAPDFEVRRPAIADLALLMLPSVAVCVEANGVYVRAFGQHYWSDAEEFQSRRAASGRDAARKVLYRYDPDRPSAVWIYDRQGRFLCVAEPYIGGGVHPLAAPGSAEGDRLGEAIALQRRAGRADRQRVRELRGLAADYAAAHPPAALPAVLTLTRETPAAAARSAASSGTGFQPVPYLRSSPDLANGTGCKPVPHVCQRPDVFLGTDPGDDGSSPDRARTHAAHRLLAEASDDDDETDQRDTDH